MEEEEEEEKEKEEEDSFGSMHLTIGNCWWVVWFWFCTACQTLLQELFENLVISFKVPRHEILVPLAPEKSRIETQRLWHIPTTRTKDEGNSNLHIKSTA
jgi:hypothetical protein